MLEVATITSIGLGVMPGVLEAWFRGHPATSVNLLEHQTVDAVVASMNAGGADVAITPMPAAWDGPSVTVGQEEFVVISERHHALAGRGSVRMAELAGDPWVHYTADHGLAGVLDHYAAEAGFEPVVAIRTPQVASVPRYAAAGVGLGLVPSNILDTGFHGAQLRLDPPRTRLISAYTRSEPDPLVAAFMQTFAEQANLGTTR
ncbi:LysR family transcriptional regulator substrate-binding protein [Pseudoclavibacter terrae]|uniref:LysR family transcriptional regulator substrate-binding protein n=1 Tax=Pseudoclavibacter terrae TaxID=1530195 RepID=UPI001FCCA96D|nr:LysR family transcriptional regulator substrate-binding protein [Pseudoclavibacter terrae]